MRKVLVVGLGGSGGKTIGFLMDEAMAQLRDMGWSKGLPNCWSFVHIDVPPQSGVAVAGRGLADDVTKQGGKYINLVNPAADYRNIDRVVFDKFANSGDQSGNGLEDLARWRPEPSTAPPSIVAGAGAYRAIGRVLTLSASENIYAGLRDEVRRLNNLDPQVGQELANTIGSKSAFENDESPIVLMVSSMAGGTGSSMIMDVADILNGLSAEIGSFKGEESVAFLYTADVFREWSSVFAGAGSQTLGAVSEILHAQTRVQDYWTDREWRQVVNNVPTPTTKSKRGPMTVFPVGSTVAGKSFGKSPEDVYRGFSRVITPILVNGSMQDSFTSYAITNWPSRHVRTEDILGIREPLVPALNGHKYGSVFGGYGSATLSTGRDRYKEYSAQRIARAAAALLHSGFEEVSSDSNVTRMAKIQTAATKIYPRVVKALNLDGSGGFDAANLQRKILNTYLGNPSAYTDEFVSVFNPAFNNGGAPLVSQMLVTTWKSSEAARKARITETGNSVVTSWAQQLSKDIQEALIIPISEFGLSVADEVLNLLVADLQKLGTTLKATAGTASDANIKSAVAGIGNLRGAVSPNNPAVPDFQSKVRTYVVDTLRSLVNTLAAETLTEFQSVILGGIRKEFDRLQTLIANEINAAPSDVISAAYRDANVANWPNGDTVPSHFQPAVNEVILTPIESFISDFERDVTASVEGVHDFQSAFKSVANRVISRREANRRGAELTYGPIQGWKDGETNGYHPHFVMSQDWFPSKLNPSITKSPVISLKLEPADLRNFAHAWLEQVGNPFEKSCRLSVSSWINSSPENKSLFAVKLSETITYASPLVELDSQMISVLHSGSYEGTSYSFSTIPVAADDQNIVNVIQPKLSNSNSANENLLRFSQSCDPSSEVQVITVSGESAPYSPWVSKSLTDPIVMGFNNAMRTSGNLESFWVNKRARSVMHFAPLGTDRLQAFLRGWLIGRITGRIKVAKESGSLVQVWQDETKNGEKAKWISFSPEVLGAKQLGVVNPEGPKDSTNWNIPAILLETMPLALARMTANDLSTWIPYDEVIKLGINLYTFDGASLTVGQPGSLDRWHSGADRAQGLESEITTIKDLDSAKTWLADVANEMDSKSRVAINANNFWSVQAYREIAKPLAEAARQVAVELERADLGIVANGSEATVQLAQSTPIATGAEFTPPSVEA